MLLSMTGYGEARGQAVGLAWQFEVRSVNNRHLKLIVRAPEPYNLWEAEFEKVVRRFIRRGTILLHLRVERASQADDVRLNASALHSYLRQARVAWEALPPDHRPSFDALATGVATLPGVCAEPGLGRADHERDWPTLERGLEQALTQLQAMRRDEGAHMARALEEQRHVIAGHLTAVRERQPAVTTAYRERLRDRINALLGEINVRVNDSDLIREVAVYADRSDIAEEIVRLDSHLRQFGEILIGDEDGPGRKLEFVAQEMGRETNTMGAKAGDVAISRRVVEIKAVLEKVRELLQNVE